MTLELSQLEKRPPRILDPYGNVTSDLQRAERTCLDGAGGGRQAGGRNAGWSREEGRGYESGEQVKGEGS